MLGSDVAGGRNRGIEGNPIALSRVLESDVADASQSLNDGLDRLWTHNELLTLFHPGMLCKEQDKGELFPQLQKAQIQVL